MTRVFAYAAFGKPACRQGGHRRASRVPALRLTIRVAAFKLFSIYLHFRYLTFSCLRDKLEISQMRLTPNPWTRFPPNLWYLVIS